MELETKWCLLVGEVKKPADQCGFSGVYGSAMVWFPDDSRLMLVQVVTKTEHVYVHEKGYAPGPKNHQKLGENAELKMGVPNSWMVYSGKSH